MNRPRHGHRLIIKQGYLKKVSNSHKITRTFKRPERRWVVFGVLGSQEPYLEFYNSEDGVFTAPPLTYISLLTCKHVSHVFINTKYENNFTIITNERVVNLIAPSRTTMLEWCSAIEQKLKSLNILTETRENDYEISRVPVRRSQTDTVELSRDYSQPLDSQVAPEPQEEVSSVPTSPAPVPPSLAQLFFEDPVFSSLPSSPAPEPPASTQAPFFDDDNDIPPAVPPRPLATLSSNASCPASPAPPVPRPRGSNNSNRSSATSLDRPRSSDVDSVSSATSEAGELNRRLSRDPKSPLPPPPLHPKKSRRPPPPLPQERPSSDPNIPPILPPPPPPPLERQSSHPDPVLIHKKDDLRKRPLPPPPLPEKSASTRKRSQLLLRSESESSSNSDTSIRPASLTSQDLKSSEGTTLPDHIDLAEYFASLRNASDSSVQADKAVSYSTVNKSPSPNQSCTSPTESTSPIQKPKPAPRTKKLGTPSPLDSPVSETGYVPHDISNIPRLSSPADTVISTCSSISSSIDSYPHLPTYDLTGTSQHTAAFTNTQSYGECFSSLDTASQLLNTNNNSRSKSSTASVSDVSDPDTSIDTNTSDTIERNISVETITSEAIVRDTSVDTCPPIENSTQINTVADYVKLSVDQNFNISRDADDFDDFVNIAELLDSSTFQSFNKSTCINVESPSSLNTSKLADNKTEISASDSNSSISVATEITEESKMFFESEDREETYQPLWNGTPTATTARPAGRVTNGETPAHGIAPPPVVPRRSLQKKNNEGSQTPTGDHSRDLTIVAGQARPAGDDGAPKRANGLQYGARVPVGQPVFLCDDNEYDDSAGVATAAAASAVASPTNGNSTASQNQVRLRGFDRTSTPSPPPSEPIAPLVPPLYPQSADGARGATGGATYLRRPEVVREDPHVLSPKMMEAMSIDDAIGGWNHPPDEDGAPPPYLPRSLLDQGPRKSLKESQVELLQKEMNHPGGVRVMLRRVDCHHTLALLDCYNKVWIGGWNQQARPFLHNAFHVGDRVISINGQVVENVKMAVKLIKNCSAEDKITFILHRLPHGRVFAIKREENGQALGLRRVGGTCEIAEVVPYGLTAKHDVPAKAPTQDGTNLCNWWITEVNNRPVSLFYKNDEVEHRLNAVGKDITILIQPSDLVKELKTQMKLIKNYKDFVVQ